MIEPCSFSLSYQLGPVSSQVRTLTTEQSTLLVVNKTIYCNSEWPVFVSQRLSKHSLGFQSQPTQPIKPRHTHKIMQKTKSMQKDWSTKYMASNGHKRKTGDSDWYGKLSLDYICLIEKTHHDSWFLTRSLILFDMFPKCLLGYLSTHGQCCNRSTKLGLKSPVFRRLVVILKCYAYHTTPLWTNTKVQSGDSKTM